MDGRRIFSNACELVYVELGGSVISIPATPPRCPVVTIPYMTQPWYC